MKLSGTKMFTIVFSLIIFILGITVGLTYSGFQSTAQSSGTLTFAVNGHSGTLNLTGAKVTAYDSQDLILTFTIASETGYNSLTINNITITMGGNALTKSGNDFKNGNIIVANYNAGTLTINRANVTSNLAITGTSSAQTYTITYNSNGGTGTMSSSTPSYGSNFTLSTNAFTRTGYTFAGWATSSGGNIAYVNSAVVKDLGNTNLYAKWIANQYMVSLDNRGADVGYYGTISVSATYGSAMPSITTPTRTGYMFGGYYTAQNGGGTQYYTSAGASAHSMDFTSNTTLYAKWTYFTITYILNGGTNSINNPTSYIQSSSSQSKTLYFPSKAHYNFDGWTVSWTDSNHSATLPTISSKTTLTIPANCYGNITLTAEWESKKLLFVLSDYYGLSYSRQYSYDSHGVEVEEGGKLVIFYGPSGVPQPAQYMTMILYYSPSAWASAKTSLGLSANASDDTVVSSLQVLGIRSTHYETLALYQRWNKLCSSADMISINGNDDYDADWSSLTRYVYTFDSADEDANVILVYFDD